MNIIGNNDVTVYACGRTGRAAPPNTEVVIVTCPTSVLAQSRCQKHGKYLPRQWMGNNAWQHSHYWRYTGQMMLQVTNHKRRVQREFWCLIPLVSTAYILGDGLPFNNWHAKWCHGVRGNHSRGNVHAMVISIRNVFCFSHTTWTLYGAYGNLTVLGAKTCGWLLHWPNRFSNPAYALPLPRRAYHFFYCQTASNDE